MNKKKYAFDSILFFTIIILSFFGLVMIFSASAPSAFALYGNSFYFVKKQLLWTVIGFGALFFTASFDYRKYKKLLSKLMLLNILLLIAVLLVGTRVKGGKRWLNLGIGTVQPSEFTKIVLVMWTAAFLDKMKKYDISAESLSFRIKKFYMPIVLTLGLSFLLLILEPHFSVIIIISLNILIMLMVYGLPTKAYLLAGLVGLPTAGLLIKLSSYRSQRILTFLDPFKDKLGSGWQTIQSLYAIGSGGLLGLGLSRSRQKHLYIPEPQNDYIFSIICEELGFLLGALPVIILFSILLWRCLKIATDCKDMFGSYLAFGYGILIVVQAALNIAVTTSVAPSTGVPLPFFSAGGSSFLFQMAAMGIVLNVSRHKEG